MRADRLITLLILLQCRGKMKARELARELEVSERTIHRDIDALSSAGIPVYGEAGPDGGFALLENYQTSLTGMTDEELRILFVLRIPEALNDLGISQDLKNALLKLSASLPYARRSVEDEVRLRFYLDWSNQKKYSEPMPYLQTIYQAVRQNRCLQITYQPMFNVIIDQVVEPYGLVAKGSDWYMVSSVNRKLEVHRISELLESHISPQTFDRPPDFDVAVFWKKWCEKRLNDSEAYQVKIRIFPRMAPYISYFFGNLNHSKSIISEDGDLILELSFDSLDSARSRLLPLGSGVEVLEPEALRHSIHDYAHQIAGVYDATDS
jgi:predicted DNA-binding transcriptional regulator YafY